MPTAPTPAAALPPADLLALATQGQLPLPQLLDVAQRWQDAGQSGAAVLLYRAWLQGSPGAGLRHVALFNLGTLLSGQGDDPGAEACYREALTLQPRFAQAHLNLGHALERKGQAEAALAAWAEVLRLTAPAPDAACDEAELPLRLHALNNSARLQEQRRAFAPAEALLVQSLQHKADQFDVLQHYVHLRQKQCEWPLYQPVGEVTPNQLLVGTSPLAMLSAHDDPALQLLAAQRFVHERVSVPAGPPLYKGRPARAGKLRLGYLSGDLCLHAVGLLMAEALELHDRSRFDLFAFEWSREDGSALRQRLLRAVDHPVRLAALDDEAAARLVAEHDLDLLIDLQGLTSGARPGILARRPAPVQVNWLGFPGTCALPGVDWIVADPVVMPPELEPFHTERPVRVPVCFQVSDRQREVAPPPRRADYGLPEDAFVYCSFNNNFKFTEGLFATWMRVLQAVPGSVLWLLADNEWAHAHMLAAAQAHGVAAERLIFAPRVAPPEYLARFALADLMLDTFPYNAGTTASDALWMGLPLLTQAGRSYISRMAASLLHAVGLPDLVTHSPTHYERLAIQLGQHRGRIASYKRYLAEQGRQSPLFDLPARVRELEDALAPLALAGRQRR
ncbi:O-linked N-acetylglucosamine transferase, SPINDLY family protein [Ideonella livida]|uniref:protein O-GlcNAc transferase n=1 Tax=Ideonella livida TaxID=2707176 RepID=A0A7C9TM56_9BURK|nr:tetratricopeptide repeat protein [Ideonella livida]NDY94019.1 tetratricopeptide repeat protein [Ideonella livida]